MGRRVLRQYPAAREAGDAELRTCSWTTLRRQNRGKSAFTTRCLLYEIPDLVGGVALWARGGKAAFRCAYCASTRSIAVRSRAERASNSLVAPAQSKPFDKRAPWLQRYIAQDVRLPRRAYSTLTRALELRCGASLPGQLGECADRIAFNPVTLQPDAHGRRGQAVHDAPGQLLHGLLAEDTRLYVQRGQGGVQAGRNGNLVVA